METIAVYFEPKVRTYGFNLKEKLLLCELTIGSESLGAWGRELQSLAESSTNFHLVWSCPGKMGEIKFFLLCDDEYGHEISSFINRWKILEIVEHVKCESLVELIYFQGPHFGDRHGIADFTLSALSKQKIPLKAMACSGAAVYLVFPHSQGVKAKAVLSDAFDIPKDKNRSQK